MEDHPGTRWLGIGIGLLIAVVAGWFVLRLHDERVFRSELDRAKAEMLAGHTAVARRMLAELASRKPGRGDVEFHLGVCELMRGHEEEALAAFRRVPDGSEHSGWAAVHQAGVLQKRGQLAQAETLLIDAVSEPGSQRSQARWELVRLFRLEGRFDEARRLFQDGLLDFEDPIAALRELYRLDVDPYAAEGVRLFLDTSGRLAPEDDRVWLGRAALATRSGDFQEADRWLRKCLERRPHDQAVWRERLDWALASGRPEEAREALGHISIGPDFEAEALELRAWFARNRDDRTTERSVLEALEKLRPTDPGLLDRLAELAIADGDSVQADSLRGRKAEVERAREAYPRLLHSSNVPLHAAELARLARTLGREFDAWQWSRLAKGQHVASFSVPPVPEGARFLSDLLPRPTDRKSGGEPTVRNDSAPPPSVYFSDSAESVGLQFVHESGASAGRLIPPNSFSGGVALLDYDRDGWIDVYLVQSGRFPPDPSNPVAGDRLFRNLGDGTFQDVTRSAGLDRTPGFGHGVTVGDFDNDGFPDLFLTRWRSYVLYRNLGNGAFEDFTEAAGLDGDRDWPTSAAFADLDGDGDLDLYVCHYLRWDEHDDRTCDDPENPGQYHCNPLDFPALPDHVFRNDDGRFLDVTEQAGIVDRVGRGLGVLATDLDGDGLVDLFVANDMTADYLFRNLGGFRFEEVAHSAGVAANANGGYQAGMGVACGDIDGDGLLDLAVTNYYNESTSFFHQLGGGVFADHTAAIGLAAPSRFRLGFGLVLFDANNDGRLDLMSANGHVHDGRPQFPWKMRAQMFVGNDQGRLVDVTDEAGKPFQVPQIGRGLATGDLDNDGRIDAVLQAQDEPVVLFHNRSEAGHFLALRLEGVESNRDAIGAMVTVESGGHRQVASRIGGGSYQSASDSRLHFGLGDAQRVDLLEVRWPSGRLDRFEDLEADTGYLIREGSEGHPQKLPGWPGRPAR